MTTRREWAATLAARAEAFDDLDDTEAETAIRGLIVEFMGAADFLMEIEVIRGRKARLARRRNAKEPTGGKLDLDLSDLLPSRTFTANPSAGPPLKKSHPLGNRNLVSRKHQ